MWWIVGCESHFGALWERDLLLFHAYKSGSVNMEYLDAAAGNHGKIL